MVMQAIGKQDIICKTHLLVELDNSTTYVCSSTVRSLTQVKGLGSCVLEMQKFIMYCKDYQIRNRTIAIADNQIIGFLNSILYKYIIFEKLHSPMFKLFIEQYCDTSDAIYQYVYTLYYYSVCCIIDCDF